MWISQRTEYSVFELDEVYWYIGKKAWSVNDEGKLVLESAGQEMVAQNEGSTLIIEQSTSGGTVSMTLKKGELQY